MAVFFRFQSHCPYEGADSGLYKEEPSANLVALVNAEHVAELAWPPRLTARDTEERYWQSTELGFRLTSGITVGALGFNAQSAARVQKVFSGLANRPAGRDSRIICVVPGFATNGVATYVELTRTAPQTLEAPVSTLQAQVLKAGHSIIDLSGYQDFTHKRALAP